MTAMQRQKLRSNVRKKFGHRNGRSSCAHSIGKFFLCYIVLFSFETSATGSPGNYLYIQVQSCICDCTESYGIYCNLSFSVRTIHDVKFDKRSNSLLQRDGSEFGIRAADSGSMAMASNLCKRCQTRKRFIVS